MRHCIKSKPILSRYFYQQPQELLDVVASDQPILHDPPRGTFTLLAQPNPGDTFGITSTISLIAGVNFVIGGTILETVQNIVNAINDLDAGMVGIVNVINEQDIGLYSKR